MDMVKAASAPAPDYRVNTDQMEKASVAYVFYSGDLIDPIVKDNNPDWRRGGVLKENFVTLKWCQGYIPRCEIRELRQQMEGEHINFINPTERKHMTKTYVIEDSDGAPRRVGVEKRRNPETLEMELVPDNILRVPFYPSDDIEVLTGQNDGIVKMPVRNRAEAQYAQRFLFPDWPNTLIPNKTAELQRYFESRLAAAQTELERAVAFAAIRSCENYRSHGMQIINKANTEMQQARVKGWPYTYGKVAEMYFEQLGVPRQDNLDRQQSNQMDAVTAALARLAELQVQQVAAREVVPVQATAPAPAKEPEVVLPPEPTLTPDAEEPPPTDKKQKKNG